MRNKFQFTLILLLLLFSCTYYNTFYNAKKSFKEGEKAQKGLAPGVRSTGANQKYEEAIKRASKVLTFHPKSKWVDDALFLMGKAYYNMGEYAKAERKFNELLASFPKSKFGEDCQYYIGLCQYNSGNELDAIQSLKLILESSKIGKKKRAQVAFMLGEIYFEREEYDQAVDYYEKLVGNFEGDTLISYAQARIGESFWLKKDYASAKEAYTKVEKYQPRPEKLFESKFKSGECSYLSGNFQEGQDIFTQLSKETKYSDKLPQVKLKIAEGILLSGKVPEAIQEYDNIIKDYPKTENSATALYQLGIIYQDQLGDLKKAKEMFDSCKAESPNSKIAKEALTKSANISKVEEYQNELSKEETEKSGKTLFLLAELYLMQMHQPDSALVEYLALADKYPESEYAAKSLYAAAWISENIKQDTTGAKQIYERILRDYPGSDYLKPALEFLNVSPDSLEIATPEEEYLKVEKLLFEEKNMDSALTLCNLIVQQFPTSQGAIKATYAIAWITEHYANTGDSAVILAYQKVIDQYPNSEYAEAARMKLGLPPQMQASAPSPPPEEKAPEQPTPDTSQVDTTLSSTPSIPMAPIPLKPGVFVYPESEKESGIKGRVTFKIMIDFQGKVIDAVLVNKTDNYFIDEAAKQAALQTTFDPQKIDPALLGGWFLYDVEVIPPATDQDIHIDQSGINQ